MKGKVILGLLAICLWWLIYGSLASLAGWLTYSLLSLPSASPLASAVEFFIFETPKVLMLLVLVVFFVGILRTFLLRKELEIFSRGSASLLATY